MIQPITLLCVALFFGVLYLRYKSEPKNQKRRTTKDRIFTAKLLLGALLVWMIAGYTFQHSIAQMDGADHAPSVMERIVKFVSNVL
jgi:hypothetical protein